jgi:glycogen debranching enzyme
MVVHGEDGDVLGMYAGIPWFSQFWARDALVSLGALPPRLKKALFTRYLEEFKNKGQISACDTGCLNSADAHGLFFKRAEDMISNGTLSGDDVYDVKDILVKDIKKALEQKTQNGFAVNGPRETWMDTEFGGDSRDGARIEIQALRLRMYNLAAKLTGERVYFELEHELSKNVREHFWVNEMLKDGIEDASIRPNIFLAYYIYPEMLYKNEWAKAFSRALEDLWLDWGGLSTISKYSPLFCPNYRACSDVNQSYHHGDSWYFLNNMTALALHKVDPKGFSGNVDKMLQASTHEILWNGIFGHHAELSSASEFASFGCLAQSWSAALYVEVLDDILN